jgi:GT2 family glycosyltransferase
MMIEYPSIYVIIVTHNAMTWINKCLTSIFKSSIPVKVIIVDNASTDNTINEIKKNFSSFLLITLNKNSGFGKANNIGLEKAHSAGADFVFLLNQDTWIEPETIKSLVEIAQKNSEYGVISPIHLNGMGNGLDYGFSIYISALDCPNLISDVFTHNERELYEVSFVNAAAWLLPKKTLSKVGGFSPIFFHYGEDNDYLNRLKYHKLKIGITPNAKIYHDRAKRISQVKNFESILCTKLILSTDINWPYGQYKIFLRTVLNILKHALRLRFTAFLVEVKCINALILKANKIHRVRSKTLKQGTIFLNS